MLLAPPRNIGSENIEYHFMKNFSKNIDKELETSLHGKHIKLMTFYRAKDLILAYGLLKFWEGLRQQLLRCDINANFSFQGTCWGKDEPAFLRRPVGFQNFASFAHTKLKSMTLLLYTIVYSRVGIFEALMV